MDRYPKNGPTFRVSGVVREAGKEKAPSMVLAFDGKEVELVEVVSRVDLAILSDGTTICSLVLAHHVALDISELQ
jgi:hypothetical protein